MAVVLRERSSGKVKKSLNLDIHIKGQKRTRTALGMFLYKKPKDQLQKLHNEETIRQAREKMAAVQLELQADANGVSNYHNSRQTFTGFFQAFIDNYKKKDYRKYHYTLHHFKTYTGGATFTLSQAFIEGFREYLYGDAGLTGETPYTYMTKFKQLCKLAFDARVIKVNPDKLNFKVKFDRHALRKNILLPEEIIKLYKAECPQPLIGKYFTLILNTGLRPGDAAGLTYKDVRNKKIGIEQGKTGNFVFIDLNKTVTDIISSFGHLKNDELLFKGLPTGETVNKALKAWCEAADINKHITIYSARHTYCTMLMRNKVDAKTIISLMGWDEKSGMEHLMRYAHFVDEDAHNAVNSLPAIDLSKLLSKK